MGIEYHEVREDRVRRVPRKDVCLFLLLGQFQQSLCIVIVHGGRDAGVREKSEWRAALHLPVAAGVLLAQGARLPLPW